MPLQVFSYIAVRDKLKDFTLTLDKATDFAIIKAENLTPDSFAIALLTHANGQYFVYYSEDYIASLEHITKTAEAWFPSKLIAYVAPRQQITFESSANSQYYTQPDKAKIDGWIPHAIEDGHNFAFLLRVEPKAQNTSYWVESRVNRGRDVPPEIKKYEPLDVEKSFLQNWQRRRTTQQ